MSGLKILRQRIQSIKSTKKVTKAMQIVSASKLKKARLNFVFATEYAFRIYEIFNVVSQEYKNRDIQITNNILVNKDNINKHDGRILFIIFGSDKGLCGSFNSGLFRKFATIYTKCRDPYVITVGKKMHDYAKQKYTNSIYKHYTHNTDTAHLVRKLKDDILEIKDLSAIYLCYNHFKNNISQIPVVKNIFEVANQIEVHQQVPIEAYSSQYEMEGADLMSDILLSYIQAIINYVVLENKVSEEAIRMVAMDNATKNATKMIDALTLKFNRQRQSMITTELTEIISGAESLRANS